MPYSNMMIVPLIGWHVAGTAGLIVSSIAKFAPSSVITVCHEIWRQVKDHPLRARFEKALKPITAGLVLVSGWLIASASAQNLLLGGIVIATAALGMFKKVHPLWVMLLGAVLGVCFLW